MGALSRSAPGLPFENLWNLWMQSADPGSIAGMPQVHLIATPVLGTAILAAVLSAEARRLPAQNVVALSFLSLISAAMIEGGTTFVRPFSFSSSVAAGSLTMASLLASRTLARLPGPGPKHLFVRTLLAAVLLAGFAGLANPADGNAGMNVAAIRIGGIPMALLLLAPWWINKRLAPARAPDWAGLAGPVLLLALALLELLRGKPAVAACQALAGSAMGFMALHALKLSGNPSSEGRSPTTPGPRSGS
jgi:hypothetical protein